MKLDAQTILAIAALVGSITSLIGLFKHSKTSKNRATTTKLAINSLYGKLSKENPSEKVVDGPGNS